MHLGLVFPLRRHPRTTLALHLADLWEVWGHTVSFFPQEMHATPWGENGVGDPARFQYSYWPFRDWLQLLDLVVWLEPPSWAEVLVAQSLSLAQVMALAQSPSPSEEKPLGAARAVVCWRSELLASLPRSTPRGLYIPWDLGAPFVQKSCPLPGLRPGAGPRIVLILDSDVPGGIEGESARHILDYLERDPRYLNHPRASSHALSIILGPRALSAGMRRQVLRRVHHHRLPLLRRQGQDAEAVRLLLAQNDLALWPVSQSIYPEYEIECAAAGTPLVRGASCRSGRQDPGTGIWRAGDCLDFLQALDTLSQPGTLDLFAQGAHRSASRARRGFRGAWARLLESLDPLRTS